MATASSRISLFLARLIGPVVAAVAIGVLANGAVYRGLSEEFVRSPSRVPRRRPHHPRRTANPSRILDQNARVTFDPPEDAPRCGGQASQSPTISSTRNAPVVENACQTSPNNRAAFKAFASLPP
jgi:hypothetical protein